MKRPRIVLLLAVACIGTIWRAQQFSTASVAHPDIALSRYVPSGALLYLQAKDFSALLADWDKSSAKTSWLQSKSHQEFSNSRIFLRLADAAKEFSSAAGFPADHQLLRQVAGTQSALAIYDIGKLEFVYITRLSPASAMQSALWKTRAKFETRSAGSAVFFLRKDPESGREVAFAVAGDYLLLATREELLAGALRLLAGENVPAIQTEAWWSQSVAAAGAEGDLRMILNLEKIVPSPYFRSYWIPRNVSDMKQYSFVVSDLFRSGEEFREERVLLRKAPVVASQTTAAGLAAVSEIVRYVPADAGAYRANANPSQAECVAALESKILQDRGAIAREHTFAPQVQLTSGATGASTDLETRIDQPSAQVASVEISKSPLKELFARNPVTAMLQVQSTELDKDGVFVRVRSAVVLHADSDWDEPAVKFSLADFAQTNVTTQKMGFGWQKRSGQLQLDGLWTLVFVIQGKYLFVADNAELLRTILANGGRQATEQPARYVAGFDHQRERQNFKSLTQILDSSNHTSSGSWQPSFFSDTIGSLSSVLRELASEKIVLRDDGDVVRETVTYLWAR